jgi:tetratricopeptide (TPR) repeat protein
MAGSRAATRRAYREADQHYTEAIAMLHRLPHSSQRDRHELSLQITLGNIMAVTRGFSAAETAEAYGQARVLAEHVGSGEWLQILYGLSVAATVRAEVQAAMAINNAMLKIAEDVGTAQAWCLVHTTFGNVCLMVGDLNGAREHFTQTKNLYREQDFRGLPTDPAVAALVMQGVTEWHLGYPDGALRYINEALALTHDLNNPFGLAFAYFGASLVHQHRGAWWRMLEASEQNLRVSTAIGFPVGAATAKIHIAYGRAKMGEIAGATESVRPGLAELVLADFHQSFWMLLGRLAEVQLLAGEFEDAMTTVERALQTTPKEFLWRPELLRLRGEIRLQNVGRKQDLFELTEHDFRSAIDIARRMNAKSDELRATMSLARLLHDTNRRDEARTILTEISAGSPKDSIPVI